MASGGWRLTWQGRQLQRGVSSGYTITYAYNADGIRTSKTVDGVKHEYLLSGSKIIAETWVQNSVEHVLLYLYDEIGAPIGLQYRNSNYAVEVYDSYFFEKNLQGDIVAIYNEAGTKICAYNYDAWGNFTVSLTSGISTLDRNVANTYNPFRYRGYYYDVETELYYLQSRYYNPAWGRFINADGYVNANGDILGYNMYAYCGNNPVMYVDFGGDRWLPFAYLLYWGEIHNAVQNKIFQKNKKIVLKTEVRLKGGLFRIDIVDRSNGIYEVKPCTYRSSSRMARAVAQLQLYIIEGEGQYHVGEHKFAGRFKHRIFQVSYWTEAPGIIFYSFELTDEAKEILATQASLFALSYLFKNLFSALPSMGVPVRVPVHVPVRAPVPSGGFASNYFTSFYHTYGGGGNHLVERELIFN